MSATSRTFIWRVRISKKPAIMLNWTSEQSQTLTISATSAVYLGVSDLGIVALAPTMEGLAIPTWTYTYLTAGLPVLTIGHAASELSRFARAGLDAHFPPAAADIAAFIEAEMNRDRNGDRKRIRAYFATHCNRPGQTGKYLALLRDL